MTTKLQKFLSKLSKSERQTVDKTIEMIVCGKLKSLNPAKLSGTQNVYRVRRGRIRIIFRKSANKEAEIIQVSKRNEKTYKDF